MEQHTRKGIRVLKIREIIRVDNTFYQYNFNGKIVFILISRNVEAGVDIGTGWESKPIFHPG